MTDGITQRVKRIIAGSANAIVDAIEDTAPDMVMEQAIREIEKAMEEVRAELGKVIAAKHLATKRLGEENEKHEGLGTKIELAVSQQREDLAEAAISQQLDIEAQLPVLEQSISDAVVADKELEGYLAALSAKRREMQNELHAFRTSRQHTVKVDGGITSPDVANRVARAESAFDRLMNKHTGLTSSSVAAGSKTASQLAELEELSRKNRIQERLAAVKAKNG